MFCRRKLKPHCDMSDTGRLTLAWRRCRGFGFEGLDSKSLKMKAEAKALNPLTLLNPFQY